MTKALCSVSGKTFPDVKHLVEALKDGRVESILVDMYTPVKRKDLFNGSWFEVVKLLEAEISHGVLLQGSAIGLAEELEKMIIANDVQTGYLQEGNDDQGNTVMFYMKYKVHLTRTVFVRFACLCLNCPIELCLMYVA